MRKQNGGILLTTLILLLVLTMIGFSSIDMNLLNQKMISNNQNKMIAFNSAEMALNDAEKRIESLSTISDFNAQGSGGYFKYDPNIHYKVWEDMEWSDIGKVMVSSRSPEKAIDSGRYIIELYTELKTNEDQLNMSNYGSSISSEKTEIFRITAYGYGATNDTYVILQSTYGKKF
jgi:type IV pilus assembly protein PilX